jgi:hypothetical protein
MRNTADVARGKAIAVCSSSIMDVSAVAPLVHFTTSMEERERCYSLVLSRTRDISVFLDFVIPDCVIRFFAVCTDL